MPHTSYAEAHAASLNDPAAWWARAAAGIDWDRPWDQVFDPASGPYGRWFPGRRTQHLRQLPRPPRRGRAGGADRPHLGHSAMEGVVRHISYAEMLDRTARVAGALAALGVMRGDRVVIYMPMVPEAAITMLACARLGAVHSVVFGGFAAAELAKTHRRRAPRGDRGGVLRPRARAGRAIQTAARRGDRDEPAPAGRVPDPATPGAGG